MQYQNGAQFASEIKNRSELQTKSPRVGSGVFVAGASHGALLGPWKATEIGLRMPLKLVVAEVENRPSSECLG